MIVYQLNIMGMAIIPTEDNSPLLIDVNTMKVGPIAAEGFQTIAWW
jgi:hypothetical protein